MPEKETFESKSTTEAYYKAFRILISTPYENAGALRVIIEDLIANEYTPTREVVVYEAPKETPAPAKQEVKETPPGYCAIHGVDMKKFEKGGRSWYSHQVNGGWCKGK